MNSARCLATSPFALSSPQSGRIEGLGLNKT